MTSRFLLPILLFVALLIGGSYYYVSIIKQVGPNATHITTKADTGYNNHPNNNHDLDLKPVTFGFNSSEPVLGSEFNQMRSDLLFKLGDFDTLAVLGTYYQGENGESLGLARATHVKGLLVDYFDSSRIKTQASYNGITTIEPDQMLEAIQFNIISVGSTSDTLNNDSLLGENTPEEEEPVAMVEEIDDKIVVHFPAGSVRKLITPEVESYLEKLVNELMQNDDYEVLVEGHSDNTGTQEENYQLGRKRAWAVKKMLWDKGLKPERIITSSQGELAPRKSNDTEAGRAYNRRVELTIRK